MTLPTSQFIEALHSLEQSENIEAIVGLFAADAQLSNPLTNDEKTAPEAFWKAYRDVFDEIQSEFICVVQTDETAMLEWTSSGTVKGQPFSYSGVSVLEFAEGRIKSFRAYFDPRQLVAHAPAKDGANEAQPVPEDAQREAAEKRSAGGYS